jgi:pyruvate dehydrogenase E2 component (dihydrolipoamide acetyltransferase)
MAVEFMMPQLGLTMTEGTVTKWFKAVGDKVAIGEILVEVETDKITNQLESTIEGVLLTILVPEGTVAPVKAPLAVIGNPGEKIERAGPVGMQASETSREVSPHASATERKLVAAGARLKASPLAKKIASEKNIDLTLVTGTGPDGRVVERDVLNFMKRNTAKATPLAAKLAAEHGVDLASIAKESRIMKDDVLAALSKPIAADGVPEVAVSGATIAGIRKVISERMSLSWHTAPHVNLTVEVDMTEAAELKNKMTQATGNKFSFTEIIAKCATHALNEFKTVNASLIDGKIYYHEFAHIGVAVALDNGLIVPVVKNAKQKSLAALREEIRSLSEKARRGELLPDDIRGGTFTITNLGMFGVDYFTPIINQPESAILGVCRVIERPVVQNGKIEIRPMMNLCLSFDHRLIDGPVAAQFMARMRQLLEQPLLLL